MKRPFVTIAMVLAGSAAFSANAASTAAPPTRDYFNDNFQIERVLDWGDRPVFSPDSKKIAFTKDDELLGPAYEMDLATRVVKCLTCKWGAGGYVSRIYYLADGSYLISGPASLETAETKLGAKPEKYGTTYLYWMPADASLPPQPLSAHAVGEVALDYDRSSAGNDRIAWGEMEPKHRMLTGHVVNDGKRAFLVDRTLLLDNPEKDPSSKVTFIETYDFIDDGKSILFFTVEKDRPFNGMYKLDIATGKTVAMPTDAQHNETHSLPNVRYGLEETNRASDPSSPYKGVSGHRPHLLSFLLKQQGVADAEAVAQKYGGKTFDLYLLDWKTGQRRQLTQVSKGGAEAHQSSPARDGQHIAFSLQGRTSKEYAGKDGLYIGTFTSKK